MLKDMLNIMSEPLVSVIIPCMNKEIHIGVCIKKDKASLEKEGF